MVLDELKVILKAETAQYTSELNKAKAQTQQFASSIDSSIKNVEQQTTKAAKNTSTITKAAVAAIAVAVTRAAISVGKDCINLASDLEEVQNVVDVAFGDMAGEVDAFAKTAIKQLGMSETTAKRMSSTFMAMGNGMGVVGENGKNMALQLTALAADMSSFYNVSQDVAETALKSVYTGETESLKKFGVVMTEANLQAYALSQGITKQYSAMSQAEKVMLRYNYVMSTTANAQGDFARTSGSWANQVRLLSEQWNQFKTTIGQGLIQALTPLIQVFNQILSAAISAGNAIAAVFGGSQVKAAAQQTASTYSGATEGAESYGDAMDDAAGSAKKLKDATAGIDELNVISEDSSSSGSGAAGGAGGVQFDTTAVDGALDTTDNKINKLVEDLKAYGKEIGDIFTKWFEDMPELKLNFDKDKALENLKNIGKNIANVIAGWTSFVVEIGIKVANDLDIGQLANDILQLIDSLTELASKITNVVVPALKKFYDIGLSPIVKWIGSKLSDALQFCSDQLKELSAWVEENTSGFDAWAEVIGRVVKVIWELLEPILNVAWETFKNIIATIVDLFKLWFGFALDLGPVILDLMDGDTVKASEDFGIAIDNLKTRFEELFGTVSKSPIAQVFIDAWASVSETWQNVATWFNDNVITPLIEFFTPILETIGAIFEGLWMIVRAVWEVVATWFNETVIQPLIEFFRPIVETIGGLFSKLWEDIKKVWGVVIEWFNTNIVEPLKTIFEPIVEAITGIFNRLWDGVKEGVTAAMNFVIDKIEAALNGIIDMINSLIDGFVDVVEWAGEVLDEDWSVIGRISHVSFPRFANGGMPDSGQMFLAREAGPELVGTIGSNNAVMNNDQIVDAVASGVYEAVTAAMVNASSSAQSINVYLDGKQIEASTRTTRQRRGATIASGGILNYG